MLNKKLMMLTIFFVLLLTVSVVSATDNTTNNVVAVEETNDEIVSIDNNQESSIEIINEDSNNLNDSVESICSIENDNVIAFENDENNLSDSTQYSVNNFGVSPDSINYGSSVSVSFILLPINNNPYEYHLKLEIINSNGESKKNIDIDGDTFKLEPAFYNKKSFTYIFGPNDLGPGHYTARLTDNFRILASRSFTINSVLYSEYTVSVKDINIDYGSSGTIFMTISPTQGMYSRYDFYLKVYDSNNKEKFKQRYHEENVNTRSVSYTIGAKTLNPGEYTIKIINTNNENQIFDTAKLTINPLPSSDFSVSVNDINMVYGNSKTLTMNITPVSTNDYNYDFYLRIFDSQYDIKMEERYSGMGSGNRLLSYIIPSKSLLPVEYTIEIVKSGTGSVKTTAKLTVQFASSSDYYVDVKDINMNYGSSAVITISVLYASKYNFNLKIYDSNNVEMISKTYSGTGSGTRSLSYTINSNDLNVGVYTIKVINIDDNHILDTAKLIVNSNQPTDEKINIIANPTSTSSNSIYYSFKIVDSNNNPISNIRFTYAIDDKMNGGYSTTDSNGIGHFSKTEYYYYQLDKLNPGKHSITIYCGNVIKKTYYEVIDNCDVDISGNVAKYKQDNYFKVSVSNNWGENVKKIKLIINVYTGKKYKSYYLTTNNKGIVMFNTNNLKIGKHKVVIISDNYCKLDNPYSYIIIKSTPKLTTPKKTLKKSVKTKKYAITLKDNQNKAIKNTKVTINVNKKIYTAKTNAKGKATFKIKKLTKKGKYNAVVTYKGNTYYNKVTKKTKIIVK